MRNFDVNRVNLKKMGWGENPLILKTTEYEKPRIKNGYLLDKNGQKIGTKGDMYAKLVMDDIMQNQLLCKNNHAHRTRLSCIATL